MGEGKKKGTKFRTTGYEEIENGRTSLFHFFYLTKLLKIKKEKRYFD